MLKYDVFVKCLMLYFICEYSNVIFNINCYN